jgi:hypothetical protein
MGTGLVHCSDQPTVATAIPRTPGPDVYSISRPRRGWHGVLLYLDCPVTPCWLGKLCRTREKARYWKSWMGGWMMEKVQRLPA